MHNTGTNTQEQPIKNEERKEKSQCRSFGESLILTWANSRLSIGLGGVVDLVALFNEAIHVFGGQPLNVVELYFFEEVY